MVKALEEGHDRCEFFAGAQTIAAGLRVPQPLGDRLILCAVRESSGTTIAVSDEEMVAAAEGIQASWKAQRLSRRKK